MNLSLKAIRFVIEALEHYQQFHDDKLTHPGISEDDASDLANDRLYLEAIKKDFERYRDEFAEQRENVNADT